MDTQTCEINPALAVNLHTLTITSSPIPTSSSTLPTVVSQLGNVNHSFTRQKLHKRTNRDNPSHATSVDIPFIELARHTLDDIACLLRLALIHSGNRHRAIIFDVNLGSCFLRDALIVLPPGPMIINRSDRS